MNYILEVKELKKIYHTKKSETVAIKDFTYNFEEGKFTMIVGPSGCGKSTLLSIIGGLENKTSGEVVKKDSIKIGYMLQEDALFPWRTILDNCLLGLEINKQLTEENRNRVIKLLNDYGLKDFINSYPQELSGGMRQRVV